MVMLALYTLAFSVIFVLVVCTILDWLDGGDGGTLIRDAGTLFKKWFSNDPKEAESFTPRPVKFSAIELGWFRRPDLDEGGVHVWETHDGKLYAGEPYVIPTITILTGFQFA